MRVASSFLRPLTLAVLAVAVLGVSGCKWFRKGASSEYALSEETRPLEVPPDLNLPNTAGAMKLPPSSPQSPLQATSATGSATSFHVVGTRDDVFNKLGIALAEVEGLKIASRANLLGTYDVTYEGSDFLVRVAAVETGVYVSAVDPRGIAAVGPAPLKLIAALKAKLGG